MPAFTYQATDPTGRTVNGTLEATDRGTAVRLLSGKGLQPFQVKEHGTPATAAKTAPTPTKTPPTSSKKTTAKDKESTAHTGADGRVKLSTGQVQTFVEELAELLGAGMRLEPALKLMEGRGEAVTAHRQAARRIGNLVREGHPFSNALRQASPSFGELFCAVAAAGEAGGSLAESMQRQAAYLASAREIRARVSVALIYPSFLLFAALAVSILFGTFLIPQLTQMVQSISGSLPKGIQVILSVTNFLKAWWPALILGFIGIVILFTLWARSTAGKPVWDRVQLRLPLAGPVLQASFHSQFLETLASLTLGGLPLLKGLDLAAGVSSLYIRREVKRAVDLVRDGGSLSRALERTNLFPTNLLEMVRIGEHTGELGDALRRSADRCARDLGKKLETAVAMMQPLIILLMAGLVGVMAYTMISVVFETMNAVRAR
jgi:type II secretory pathway component PulF